jgi:AraC-like DNA-binding protein
MALFKNDQQKLADICSYIRDHIDEQLDTSIIGKKFGIGRFTLNRQFLTHYHQTLNGYIRKQRIDLAYALLMEKDCNVTEVAFTVGYTDRSAFSRAFAKQIGQSPRDILQTDQS